MSGGRDTSKSPFRKPDMEPVEPGVDLPWWAVTAIVLCAVVIAILAMLSVFGGAA